MQQYQKIANAFQIASERGIFWDNKIDDTEWKNLLNKVKLQDLLKGN